MLGIAKLLCQLIAFGYKNIRVNQSLLIQQGQSVTLIQNIGYFPVQFHRSGTPQHLAFQNLCHLLYVKR